MIEIKYVCSNGEEYNLIGDKMRATSGYRKRNGSGGKFFHERTGGV